MKIRELLARKARQLQVHEEKNFARTGVDISNYVSLEIENRLFFVVSTNVFKFIMNEVLIEACEKYPGNFGQLDAIKVLKALLQIERPPLVNSLEDFMEFLRTEQFAWAIEIENNEIKGDILRLDLYRKLELVPDSLNREKEFIGGLFHAFKHFSYKNIPLSTQPCKNDLIHPTAIYERIIRGFFINKENKKIDQKLISFIPLDDKYILEFIFYHENNSDVYFITTIIKRSIKN